MEDEVIDNVKEFHKRVDQRIVCFDTLRTIQVT